MAYRARPRYEAKVQARPPAREKPRLKGNLRTPPERDLVAPAGRWEPGHVLDALSEMHNSGRAG